MILASAARAETFARAEVHIAGPIEYGATSPRIRYTGTPRFQALAFNARPGDRIEVTVLAERGAMRAYLTDAGYRALAGGKRSFSATIPAEGKPATYYILVLEERQHSTSFRVGLERPAR